MSEACGHAVLPGLVPTARQMIVPVIEQVRLARDTYRLRLECPDLARQVVPGQFVMIRRPGVTNPLLGRPFALYDTWLNKNSEPAGIDVVYLVVGRMTGVMSEWKTGDRAEVWGPLGNGFPVPQCDRLLLVAGGIGNTPFLAVAREALGGRTYGTRNAERGTRNERAMPHPLHSRQVSFCYGTRSAEYLAGLEDFGSLGIDVRLATDDGTRGHKGFVTDLVEELLEETRTEQGSSSSGSAFRVPRSVLYCCGPEPMMHAVAGLAAKHGVPCWLSLETPMACGFGACFSCVTRVRQPDGEWDYKRTCVEGPIFAAEQLVL